MKRTICLLSAFLLTFHAFASSGEPDGPLGGIAVDGWEVAVNQMDDQSRNKINSLSDQLEDGQTRGVLSDVLMASLSGGISATVDVVATQIVNLVQYRKQQKNKWMRMIQNECNYTDSIVSLKGLNDFYSKPSEKGALDPSDMNFDGISIRGMRNGSEVLFMSCHIDRDRLDHLFNHSKFNLVLDTLSFNAYNCHLPNLQANGIRNADAAGRDNSFSFDERDNLSIALDFSLSSSWINEATMVMSDVELGKFSLHVNIPKGEGAYTYSRRQIEQNRLERNGCDTTFIAMEGDCFVVPRSFMPVSASKRAWGTGEYKIKVKMRESCRFVADKDKNRKMKEWYKDYRQLLKMQQKGTPAGEYFSTVWQQNGNTIMKQMLKQGMNKGVSKVIK
ncbi:MAG: hypothetical protein ACI4TM_11320 [Candidatus Cryptobacteroides sp.]